MLGTSDREKSVRKSSPMSRISFCESCTSMLKLAIGATFWWVTNPSTNDSVTAKVAVIGTGVAAAAGGSRQKTLPPADPANVPGPLHL